MVLKYQISPYPALMEDMIVKIWEAESDEPGAEVYTQNIPQDMGGGHSSINTITVNGLDLVVHIVRLFAVTSGNKLHEYTAEPKVNVVTVFTPIRFKIGDGGDFTPGVGDSEYINPILEGMSNNDYLVMRNNQGLLFPDLHYFPNPGANKFALQAGDVFSAVDEFTILMQPSVIQNTVNDSVVGKWFKGFVDVAASTDYEAAHLRKLIRFTGTAPYNFITAPPKHYGFCFQNFANATVGTINFTNAPLKLGAVEVSTLTLPNLCEACFVFDGDNWNVVYLVKSNDLAGGVVAIPNGTVLGTGNFNVGAIVGSDPVYDIIHNLAIAGDYNVQISLKSNAEAGYFNNNKVCSTWWHHEGVGMKPNRFRVSLQRNDAATTSLSISWVIFKN